MKREARTKKDLLRELRSQQRKIKLLEKASLTDINKNQTITKQSDDEYNSIVSDTIAGLINTPEGKLIANRKIIKNVAVHFEKALRKIESKYYQIFKNSINAIFLTDSENNIIAANPEACRIFGRTEPEFHSLKSLNLFDVTDTRTSSTFEEQEHNGIFRGEFTFMRKDNSKFPGLASGSSFTDEDGRKKSVIFIYEISGQKRAEEAINKAAAEIYDLYNNAPCGYHSLNSSGTFVRINKTELDWIGYNSAEIVGKMKFTDILSSNSRKIFEDSFELLKTTGITSELELEVIRKDNSVISVLLSETAITSSKGDFLMSRSTLHDITKHMEAETALKKRKDDLERIERLTIDRELKMIELKKKVTELQARLSVEEKKYE